MNLLSLEQFRAQLGYHPWHFWGLANNRAPVTSACNDIVQEYAWQATDAVGRSEMRAAIVTAEQRLFEHLGYAPAPRYREQTLTWPKYNRTGFYRALPVASDGRWIGVELNDGYIQAVGIEAHTFIQTVAVTYSDEDSDGLDDTFTVSFATTVQNADELALYFIPADRFDDTRLGVRWRIDPIIVDLDTVAGTATIIGRSYLLVKPILYEGVNTAALDPDNAANLVTELAAYRRYTDPNGVTNTTSQALLIWETTPCLGWWCCGSASASYTNDASHDPAAQAYAMARAGIRDSRNGIIAPGPAAYNATTGLWAENWFATGTEPDRLTVRYLAGKSLVQGHMDYALQTVVARLAAAELDRPICACENANRTLGRWQEDLARTGGNNDAQFGAISQADLDNPLGTRRGHIYAWRYIQQNRRGQASLV